MEVSRRSLLLGAIGIGGTGTIWIATTDPLSHRYESVVSVRNERSSSVAVDLILENHDKGDKILDKSVTLPPEDRFRREGVLSKSTQYRISVRADDLVFDETFRTCCRGYHAEFAVRPTELEVWLEHTD